MKQANYNGRFRAALAALGVALTASHRLRGAICLDIIYFPRMSPRFARLNTGLRTAATPPGCPARSASKWVADCVPCDAASSTALRAFGVADCVPCDAALASLPMGTNAASLRCRFALSGLCGVALPFHDVKVRFKFRGY